MTTAKLKRALGFRDLIFFYVISGLSLRWIATAAAAGPSAITIWITALLGFFVPLAGCVLDLSSRYPAEGGLYIWTREAFGPFSAFMAAWTYWMSNLPYFPAVLFFAASSLLYLGRPMQDLAESQLYFLVFTVVMLALITLLNVVGLEHAASGSTTWARSAALIPAVALDRAWDFLVLSLWVGNAFHAERDGAAAGHEEPDFSFDDLLCIWRMRGGVVHG